MAVILTTTWNPRGEMERLNRMLPQLRQLYAHLVVVVPPDAPVELTEELEDLGFTVVVPQDWSWGRYMALQKALEQPGEHIHYVDMDRLLHWVETRPEEWRGSVEMLQQADCLVFGRTPAAYATHPQALVQTEMISNLVVSYLLGRTVDVSAGSKGFSRATAEFLMDHIRPGYVFGMDAEWLVLANRAGFGLKYVEVDGLDWESADRYQDQAASVELQERAAREYDADPDHWQRRVEVALEVAQCGLEAARKPLNESGEMLVSNPLANFEVEDYLYFYSLSLTEERTEAEVASIMKLLALETPLNILDLACGFGRHTNRLAALGHRMTGLDLMEGFLEIARRDAEVKKLVVDYRQGDMRKLDFHEEFDRVLLLFTAFGYFEDHENLRVLKNITRALKPDGLFLFDIPNRDGFVKNLPPCIVTERDGNLMIDRGSFDSLSGRWYNRRVVIRNGVRRDKPFYVRLYNPNEILALLEQAGLKLDKMYGSWDAQPVVGDSRRMIIVARKLHR
jgi:SAM-dependent methyltransferase